jgi:uncharacterized membrane protein YoaK (UPF0700 family)
MEGYRWTKAFLVFLAFIVGVYGAVRIGVFIVIHQLQFPALGVAVLIVLGLVIHIDRQIKNLKEENTPQD